MGVLLIWRQLLTKLKAQTFLSTVRLHVSMVLTFCAYHARLILNFYLCGHRNLLFQTWYNAMNLDSLSQNEN